MKIALIKPPDTEVLDASKDMPFNLLFLASALSSKHEVRIYDIGNKGIDYQIEHADIFGITSTTPSYPDALLFSQQLKATYPESRIMIGGAHANNAPKSINKSSIFDTIVSGECECNIVSLINSSGIVNGEAPRDLSQYHPLPYELIDCASYLNKRNIDMQRTITLMIGRGCEFKCNFCVVQNKSVRYLSVGTVRIDLQFWIENYDIDSVCMIDDNFMLYGTIFLSLFRHFGLKFGLQSSINLLNKKNIDSCITHGCKHIVLGVESGSDKMLSLMNKKHSTVHVKKIIGYMKDKGLSVRLHILVGFPGETMQTIEETIYFVKSLPLDKTDSLHINPFVPYPGTEAFVKPDKYGIKWISKNWRDFRTKDKEKQFRIAFETELLTREDMLDMCNLVRSELVEPGVLV